MVEKTAVQPNRRTDNDQRYPLDEYFQLEEKATYKSEFHNGKIIPTAGGTIEHGVLSGHIYALLLMLFFNSEEEIKVYSSEQKIYISEYSKGLYSDTCVVKGKEKTYQGGNQAILNPTLIVEVASKSTERYDRYGKFRMYRSLPSFEEYVIIDQYMPVVEVFYKIAEDKWQMSSFVGLDKTITFCHFYPLPPYFQLMPIMI